MDSMVLDGFGGLSGICAYFLNASCRFLLSFTSGSEISCRKSSVSGSGL